MISIFIKHKENNLKYSYLLWLETNFLSFEKEFKEIKIKILFEIPYIR